MRVVHSLEGNQKDMSSLTYLWNLFLRAHDGQKRCSMRIALHVVCVLSAPRPCPARGVCTIYCFHMLCVHPVLLLTVCTAAAICMMPASFPVNPVKIGVQ